MYYKSCNFHKKLLSLTESLVEVLTKTQTWYAFAFKKRYLQASLKIVVANLGSSGRLASSTKSASDSFQGRIWTGLSWTIELRNKKHARNLPLLDTKADSYVIKKVRQNYLWIRNCLTQIRIRSGRIRIQKIRRIKTIQKLTQKNCEQSYKQNFFVLSLFLL